MTSNNNLVVISVSDLQSLIYESVCKAMAEREAATAPNAQDKGDKELYTADEVCKLLDITKPTLWRWGKAKYLCPVKVGTKNYYKVEAVNKLLNA